MKTVFSIIGKKRVGKDLVADYICQKRGCKKYALAKPLKDLVCNIFGITMEQLDQYKNEAWGLDAYPITEDLIGRASDDIDVSFRSILQRTGDSMKNFFGIDCYMKKFHEWFMNEDVAVISDVRLKEEQRWLTAHTSPVFIKVIRDNDEDTDSKHRTETESEALGYDIIIENNGTIEELYEKIDKILDQA